MVADQIVAPSRGDFRPKICIGMLFERFEITYHLYEQVVVIIARYMIIKVFLIVSTTVFYLAAMAWKGQFMADLQLATQNIKRMFTIWLLYMSEFSAIVNLNGFKLGKRSTVGTPHYN